MSSQQLRFAILCRVSTELQEKEGVSLEVQEIKLTEYVGLLGGVITEKYIGQEHSTPGYKRPIFEKMLDDASKKTPLFNAIMIYDWSRWARDDEMSAFGLAILKKQKIKLFVQMQEYNLNNPETEFMATVLTSAGKLQAALIKNKSIEARIELAKRGWPVVGKPPFGRVLKDKDHSKEPEWIIEPEKLEFAQHLYDLYINQGIYVEKIGKILGIDSTRIYRILKDRGVLRQTFNSNNEKVIIETKLPSLFTLEQQEMIKNRLKSNKRENSKKYDYLLSSYVRCNICGYTHLGCRFGKDRTYYRHAKYGRTEKCSLHIPGKKIDNLVIEHISEIICSKSKLIDIIKKCNDASVERQEKLLKEQKTIIKKIEILNHQLDRVVMLVVNQTITDEEGERTLKKIRQQLDENKLKIQSIDTELLSLTSLNDVEDTARKVAYVFNSLEEQYGHSVKKWDFKIKKLLVQWFFGVSKKNGIFVELTGNEITYTIKSDLGTLAFGFLSDNDDDGVGGVTGFNSNNNGNPSAFKSIIDNIIINTPGAKPNLQIRNCIGNYERWLYTQGIIATGSIRPHPSPRRLAEAERYPVNRYRQQIVDRFQQALPGNPYVGILTALAVGERGGISSWQWETFRRTGASHLMAISGTHIGLIASLAFALIWNLWGRVSAWTLYWPATRAAALGALIGAGGYTLLSGLAVPAQRSFLMVAVAMLALMASRPAAAGRTLALALLVVLIADPGAPMGVGFWLSFGAVAVILYSVSGRWRERHAFGQTVRLQLNITLGLLPPTLLFFQQFPLIAPVANLIAIPWVGLTVLPLSLLAALLTPVSAALQSLILNLAAMTMEGLWHVLCELDQWPDLVLHRPTPPVWTLALALIGVAWLLAPRGLPGRWLGIPLCLPLLWPPMPGPVIGGFWFSLLDVGEGLSAVVRTRNHVLVYDTGRRLGFTLDAGRAALAPFLRWQGAERVDTLIVSHADSQHVSGVRSLRELLPVERILTSAPEQTPIDGAEPCQAGQAWEWDGVRFQVLHPPPQGFSDDNASCVLKVEGITGRVLLPGDIETRAEIALAKTYGNGLTAEVLVAPHQGRRNLSTPIFLDAVHPRYILFATGYHNRYGYPRADTVARYQATGAALLDSSYEGALTFRLEPGQPLVPERERSKNPRYWDAP